MKKFFVLGLIAVALSAGLMLTSCAKCPGLNGKDKGSCSLSVGSALAKDCEDHCISMQVSKNPLSVTSAKCNC